MGKMELLVHELLVSDAWQRNVLPFLSKDLSSKDSLRTYFLHYHEAVLINLLEVVFFNKDAVLACGESLLDLVDYCFRKMSYLNSIEDGKTSVLTAQELMNMSSEERWLESKKEMEFGIAISSLSVFRYITDQITHVPLSVMSRILFFHEMTCSCVYLIEKAPWLKRGTDQKVSRFENGTWSLVPHCDLPRLCKIEAQVIRLFKKRFGFPCTIFC